MEKKIAIIAAIAAVVILIIAGIAVAMMMKHGSGDDDSGYVVYYGNGKTMSDGSTTLKTTDKEVKNADMFDDLSIYFLIWNTKADGTGTNYTPGQEVELGTKLYAVWAAHYMSIGNMMSSIDGLGLTMKLSDDISEDRPITALMALSNSGEFTIAISGWYSLYWVNNNMVEGKTYSEGNMIQMMPEASGEISHELTVEGKTVYFKVRYDSNLTVSAPYVV